MKKKYYTSVRASCVHPSPSEFASVRAKWMDANCRGINKKIGVEELPYRLIPVGCLLAVTRNRVCGTPLYQHARALPGANRTHVAVHQCRGSGMGCFCHTHEVACHTATLKLSHRPRLLFPLLIAIRYKLHYTTMLPLRNAEDAMHW